MTRVLKSKCLGGGPVTAAVTPAKRIPLKSSSFLFAVLSLAVLCGCDPPSALIGPTESIMFRVVATLDADAKIAEAAAKTTERFVTRDEQVVAEWVPISNAVSLDAKSLANSVTRRIHLHTEVLVLHTVNDISENEIAAIEGSVDNASRDHTLVTLTDAGSRMLYPFTIEHLGRAVAVIADGEVRAIPEVMAPISRAIVLTPEKLDKVRIVSSGGTN